MEPPVTDSKLFRFGVFELDLSARQLRKHGRKLKLQDQPYQVLAVLVQHAGEVVGREQIRQALWPAGVFVDFDASLNTAIKKIRHALADSAENPRFIETLPRTGYRFVAPVSCAAPALPAVAPPRTFRREYRIAASIALVLGGLAVALLLVNFHRREETFAAPVPFTTYPGVETQPSFSPDGERVAFSWNGGTGDNFDIYVKQIGTEKPLRLTTSPAADTRPSWSPDGRLIAFVRDLPDGRGGILLVPSIGGPERKLTETRRGWAIPRNYAPAWTPDSKWLAFPDRDADNPADETSSIYALRLDTGEKRRLTHAPAAVLHMTGAFSRDGRSLVFRRWTNDGAELYLLRLSSDLRPAEEPVRLTSGGGFVSSPAWTWDGREIVYVRLGLRTAGTVWRAPTRPPGKPTRLTAAGDEVRTLAAWGQRNRLVYERTFVDRDIWRMELGASGQGGPPTRVIASSFEDGSPAYSPDGKRIGFASKRSGRAELWICASDGSDPVQLTALKGRAVGPPRWSPDGRRIFFDSDAAGNFDIYVVEPDGSNLRRLTNHPADEALPSLSADGRWLYFTSSRSGRWEIWKTPVEGGEAAPVTSNGGWVAFESPDGKYLYYAKSAGLGSLWRRAAAGGPEQEVAAPILGNTLATWPRGIYFARPPTPGGGNVIELYSFATGQIQTLATTPRPVYWFLSVSPDQRSLLYTETTQLGSDLMLVDSFR